MRARRTSYLALGSALLLLAGCDPLYRGDSELTLCGNASDLTRAIHDKTGSCQDRGLDLERVLGCGEGYVSCSGRELDEFNTAFDCFDSLEPCTPQTSARWDAAFTECLGLLNYAVSFHTCE